MSQVTPTDEQWLNWIEAQQRATRTWIEKEDVVAAIREVDEFLELKPPSLLRRQAIGFRGSLHEESGDLDAARRDFSEAVGLSEEADYERYTLELAMGALHERLGEENEAVSWYLRSMRTVMEDPSISGGTALLKLLKVRGEQAFSEEELRLVERVVRQSWDLLCLEGEPDFTGGLRASAEKLIEAQSRPFPKGGRQ